MDIFNNSSVEELLGVVLGNEHTAFRVSKYIESHTRISKDELCNLSGVGEATADKILAVMELHKRYIACNAPTTVMNPEDVVHCFPHLRTEEQEHFVVVSLDASNHIIGKHDVTIGLANQTPIHPRECFRPAIDDGAVSVIVAHNHPSGNTEPSSEDISITKVLVAAGKILQIPLIDHIIITRCGARSICRESPYLFE